MNKNIIIHNSKFNYLNTYYSLNEKCYVKSYYSVTDCYFYYNDRTYSIISVCFELGTNKIIRIKIIDLINTTSIELYNSDDIYKIMNSKFLDSNEINETNEWIKTIKIFS